MGDFPEPAVYRSTTRVSFVGVGEVTTTNAYRAKMLYAPFRTGMIRWRRTHHLIPRLDLALELHAASFFERSAQARFLTLVTVLEVLKDQRPLPRRFQELIDGWKEQLRVMPEKVQAARQIKDSLSSVLGRVGRQSIGGEIRRLVARYLGAPRAASARSFYEIRSRFLHDGVDLGMGSNVLALEKLVRDLLWRLI